MSRTSGKVLITVEVTPEEREQIKENAAWMQMSMAAFLRKAGMGETIDLPTVRERIRNARRTA